MINSGGAKRPPELFLYKIVFQNGLDVVFLWHFVKFRDMMFNKDRGHKIKLYEYCINTVSIERGILWELITRHT